MNSLQKKYILYSYIENINVSKGLNLSRRHFTANFRYGFNVEGNWFGSSNIRLFYEWLSDRIYQLMMSGKAKETLEYF